ncbi:DUF4184 family protein [Streptomyces sp. NPDC093589]|uniref:DUF4184 family protein n=1 Tax=Streptomyces sp. NPDC093589 TaxID=3366043 RepID=UPI00381F6006
MPFTLSHAAAVLPAIRRTGAARGPLIASALVAGSFAPDMTYFADTVVPGAMLFGDVTHGLPGVLTVDVLVTAVLVAGWLLLREPLAALLPRAWQGRVYALARGRARTPRGIRELAAQAGRFYVSAVLGAATHVVWDAFTHAGRWGTRLVPGLDRTVGGLPASMYLQYGTSALALAAIGWFLWSALRGGRGVRAAQAGPGAATATGDIRETDAGDGGAGRAAADAVPALTVRMRLLLTVPVAGCVIAGGVYRTLRAHAVYGSSATWFDHLPPALFGAGAGLVLGLLVYAVAVRLLHRRGRGAAGGAGGGGAVRPVRPAADTAAQPASRR